MTPDGCRARETDERARPIERNSHSKRSLWRARAGGAITADIKPGEIIGELVAGDVPETEHLPDNVLGVSL
jgi:hypothetical protein